MINLLIGPIADLAGTWLKGKVETQKAKTEMVVSERKMQAQINLKKSEADIDWDGAIQKYQARKQRIVVSVISRRAEVHTVPGWSVRSQCHVKNPSLL